MVSKILFTALVVAVAFQRLLELRLSRKNERLLRARGAIEYAPEQVEWMTALHSGWLVAMPLEVWMLNRTFEPRVAIAALLAVVGGQLLRYAAIYGLRDRWNVRVLSVRGEPAIRSGIYKRLRHPNYLGVVLEIAALPLVHGAWLTATVASFLNAALLRARIRVEEAALRPPLPLSPMPAPVVWLHR